MKLTIALLLLASTLNAQSTKKIDYTKWPCPDYFTKGNGTCVEPRKKDLPISYHADGTPYQCSAGSYYGAYCWIPAGVPKKKGAASETAGKEK